MATTTYFLLFLVIVHVAYSISCDTKLKDEETESVDCGEGCDFCHMVKRSGGADGENFESTGCGCGEHSIVKSGSYADFEDCDRESESISANPKHAYQDEEKCCKRANCN